MSLTSLVKVQKSTLCLLDSLIKHTAMEKRTEGSVGFCHRKPRLIKRVCEFNTKMKELDTKILKVKLKSMDF